MKRERERLLDRKIDSQRESNSRQTQNFELLLGKVSFKRNQTDSIRFFNFFTLLRERDDDDNDSNYDEDDEE